VRRPNAAICPSDRRAAAGNETTDYGVQQMRPAIAFVTSAKPVCLADPHLFVAAGRLLGAGRIDHAVHRVA